MKKLKLWQMFLIALAITGLSSLTAAMYQIIVPITRYGWPIPYAEDTVSWTGKGSGPIFSTTLSYNPAGFIVDLILYFAIIWALNHFFLKKRK